MKRFLFVLCILLIPASSYSGWYYARPTEAGGEPCSIVLGDEANTANNASMPSASDTNATTGWSSSGVAGLSSVSTDTPYLGTYHVKATADSAEDDFAVDLTGLSLTDNTLYEVSVYVKTDGTNQWKIGFGATIAADQTPFAFNSSEYALYRRQFAFGKQLYLVVRESNASNAGDVFVDNLSIKPVTSGCYGDELSSSSALSIDSDSDATTGVASSGLAVLDSRNEAELGFAPQNGTYAVYMEANSNDDQGTITITGLSAGKEYLADIWARHTGTGGQWAVFVNSTIAMYIPVTDTTWTRYAFSLVAASTSVSIAFKESSATNDGSVVIDSFSFKEVVR